MLSGAQAVSAATPHAPSWHPVLSVPGGGVTEAVVATGKTTGWAFLRNGAAYQRVGATAWKKVAFPGRNGYVDAAAASSRSTCGPPSGPPLAGRRLTAGTAGSGPW